MNNIEYPFTIDPIKGIASAVDKLNKSKVAIPRYIWYNGYLIRLSLLKRLVLKIKQVLGS